MESFAFYCLEAVEVGEEGFTGVEVGVESHDEFEIVHLPEISRKTCIFQISDKTTQYVGHWKKTRSFFLFA